MTKSAEEAEHFLSCTILFWNKCEHIHHWATEGPRTSVKGQKRGGSHLWSLILLQQIWWEKTVSSSVHRVQFDNYVIEITAVAYLI